MPRLAPWQSKPIRSAASSRLTALIPRCLECQAGRALSLDGRTWQLQIGLELARLPVERVEAHRPATKLHPLWQLERGKGHTPAAIQPSGRCGRRPREQAEQTLADLRPALADFPFPPGDPYQPLAARPVRRSPLALLGSARARPELSHRPAGRWKAFPPAPGPAAGHPGPQRPAAAGQQGGVPGQPAWRRQPRESNGSCASRTAAEQALGGWHLHPNLEQRPLPADAFPPPLLREDWPDPEQDAQVTRYQARMAPRLLTLANQGTQARRPTEALAWQKPRAGTSALPAVSLVLDREGLQVTLIKARLILSGARA